MERSYKHGSVENCSVKCYKHDIDHTPLCEGIIRITKLSLSVVPSRTQTVSNPWGYYWLEKYPAPEYLFYDQIPDPRERSVKQTPGGVPGGCPLGIDSCIRLIEYVQNINMHTYGGETSILRDKQDLSIIVLTEGRFTLHNSAILTVCSSLWKNYLPKQGWSDFATNTSQSFVHFAI